MGVAFYVLIAVPVLVGLRRSLRDRHLDRRHFVSFVGFIAALVAVTAATLGEVYLMWLGLRSPYYNSFVLNVLVAILSLSALLGCAVAFVGGLFSTGRRRIFLIAFATLLPFMFFIEGLARQGT